MATGEQTVLEPANGQKAAATFNIRYFAWVREKIGRGEETLVVPNGIETVADLVTWLKTQGPEYEAAFERTEVVRAAIDHVHVKPSAKLGDAREIAFFPPVTGG